MMPEQLQVQSEVLPARPAAAARPTASSGSLVRQSSIFAAASLGAYLLSMLKAIVVARIFGTTADTDAFTIAVLFPNLLATLIAGGSAVALVPALTAAEQRSPRERADLFRSGLALFSGFACILSIGLAFLAHPLLHVVASRFTPGQMTLAGRLLHVSAIMLFLNAVYSFCSAELLFRRRYAKVAGAPAISTLVSLLIILLWKNLGVSILAYGLVAGLFIQALVVFVPAWRANWTGEPIRWWSSSHKQLSFQQLTLVFVSGFSVLNVTVDQMVAGFLPAGNLTALNYATTLHTVVVQVAIMAASWVVLPEFSELVSAGNTCALKCKLRASVAGLTAVAAPVSALILIAGERSVRILFQHGAFDSRSTSLVFNTWAGYTLGLVPLAVGMMGCRTLSASGRNHLLLIVGALALPLNALLDYVFMMRWGCVGISLSTSAVFVGTTTIIFLLLHRWYGSILDRNTWKLIGASSVGSVIAGLAAWAVGRATPNDVLGLAWSLPVFAAVLFVAFYAMGVVNRESWNFRLESV